MGAGYVCFPGKEIESFFINIAGTIYGQTRRLCTAKMCTGFVAQWILFKQKANSATATSICIGFND